ncbi:transcription factor iiic-gamma subunit [Nannochloropsis gaditana]|uniref:Transcription factor iiic-gamma subunit n=1 Tax=Nannochloropsis gaditana TaxID=72520 RepID=W7TY69_9STRA|nr:transcription factor iiic-gamma subunit [Nannochloropsis gaditana]
MRAEYREALRLLNEVVRQAPTVPDPYQTMGQIYEDQGEIQKAAEINLVGCQFGPKDARLWKKTGQMFLELGRPFYLKAQYCFGRAIKLDRQDVEAIADRAHVQSLWGRVDKAVLGYEAVLRLNPSQPEQFLLRLAEDCLREARFWEKGLEALSEVLCRVMGALFVAKQIKFLPVKAAAARHVPSRKMEAAYEAASTLCRHLMGLKRYADAAAVVQALHLFIAKLRERPTRFAEESEEQQQLALPVDLVVRFGICQLYLDKLTSALQCFSALRQADSASENSSGGGNLAGTGGGNNQGEVAGLLEEVAQAFMDTGKFFRALEILRRLDRGGSAGAGIGQRRAETTLPRPGRLRVKLQMARCLVALNQLTGAASVLDQIEGVHGEGTSGKGLGGAKGTTRGGREGTKGLRAPVRREVVVLQAATARGLKEPASMAACLARTARELAEICEEGQGKEAGAEEGAEGDVEHGGGTGDVPGTASSREGGPPGPSRPCARLVEGGGADTGGTTSVEGIDVTGQRELEGEREEEEEGEVTCSVDARTTEFELFLEYGLLCRALGRDQDFFSVVLTLVEMAVFQSKSDFRRSRRNRGAVEEEEADWEGERQPVEGGEVNEGRQGGKISERDQVEGERRRGPIETAGPSVTAAPGVDKADAGQGAHEGGSLLAHAQDSSALSGPVSSKSPPHQSQSEIAELLPRTWPRTPFQVALERHLKVHASRVEVLTWLGEPKVYEAARALIQACVESARVREAGSLARVLVQRKHLLTEEHGRELHEYALSHAVNEDDYSSAIKSCIVSLSALPTSIERGNALNRLVRKATRADANRAVIRRMAHKTPESLPLALLSGNAFALSRNYQMALDKFLGAYRMAPSEPLVTLAAAALLMRVLSHRKLVARHGCLVKCLAFLEQYARLRLVQGVEEDVLKREAGDGGGMEDSNGAHGRDMEERGERLVKGATRALEQEVVYNMGRAFHQAGLLHMAVPFYQDALTIFDRYQEELRTVDGKGHVTREAAWNLVCIYKEGECRELARLVVGRYLRMDRGTGIE